mgnify:CR=1 FL=1
MIHGIGIGADLEQGADEGQRAVVDRVLQAWADRQRHGAVGNEAGIVDRRPERAEITGPKGAVDLLEPLVLRAQLFT